MPSSSNLLLAILVTHLVIYLVQRAARRWGRLDRTGQYGIYLTLLPIGFACFGRDVPILMIGAMALVGQTLVIWSLRSRSAT